MCKKIGYFNNNKNSFKLPPLKTFILKCKKVRKAYLQLSRTMVLVKNQVTKQDTQIKQIVLSQMPKVHSTDFSFI